MSGFLRLYLIIMVLTAVYLNLCAFPAPATSSPGLERQEHLRQLTGLEQESYRLAQELLVLDLRLKKTGLEIEAIQKDLATTISKKEEAAEKHQESLENQRRSFKKIGRWINFQYRYGHWGLLEVILGSESLSDLINRSLAVSILLERQAADYRKAAENCAALLQSRNTLAELEDRLNRQHQSLAGEMDNLSRLSDQRRQFLEDIQRDSRDLAQRVAYLEKQFLDSLNLVELLSSALAKFAWNEVKPDRVAVRSGGLLVELTEATLNRSLRESGLKDLEGYSVSLRPGLFVIIGRDKNSPSMFALGGTLVPSGQSAAVRLEPSTLDLDGVPVAQEVVRQMAAGSDFQFSLPAQFNLKPSRIEIKDRAIGITLSF